MQRHKINKTHFSLPTFDDISQIDQQRTHRNKYRCLILFILQQVSVLYDHHQGNSNEATQEITWFVFDCVSSM